MQFRPRQESSKQNKNYNLIKAIEFKEPVMQVTLLKSGNVLSESDFDDNQNIVFKVWDLSAKKCITTHTHLVTSDADHFPCYLPEGPVLKGTNDALDITPEQEFIYRAAIKQPDYYYKLKTGCGASDITDYIAYTGDNHYIVANRFENKMTDDIFFDVFEKKSDELVKLKKIRDEYAIISNPVLSLTSRYQSVSHITMMSEDMLCITSGNRIDFWKKKGTDNFNLLRSFNLTTHHDSLRHLLDKYKITCIKSISDHELLFQASTFKSSTYHPNLLFKVDLEKNTIQNVINLPEQMGMVSNNQIISIPNTTNLHIVKADYSTKYFFLDTNAMSIQPFLLPNHLKIAGVTENNDLLVYNSKGISVLEFPALKEYLKMTKNIKKEMIVQGIGDKIHNGYKPILGLIADYVGEDVRLSAPEVKETKEKNPSLKSFLKIKDEDKRNKVTEQVEPFVNCKPAAGIVADFVGNDVRTSNHFASFYSNKDIAGDVLPKSNLKMESSTILFKRTMR